HGQSRTKDERRHDHKNLNLKPTIDAIMREFLKIDDLFDQLQGSRYFSRIDLHSAYRQLIVHEADIPKTASRTLYEHFEFTLMLFGLTNALAIFMDLMNRVCKPYLDKFVIMFIDDILIYSKSKEDHKLEEVCFLGHVVNNNDINVNSSKIEAMKNWKVPKTPSEIRSFLGLTVYCDTSNQGHGYVLMQRGKRWIELFSDYDCEIRYHLGKANVVVDAFSRKKIVKPRQVRAISMTIRPSVTDKILVAQGDVRTIFMDEAHASRYLVHPGADKTYYDLGDMHWRPCMKKDVATYVSNCLTCSKVKAKTSKTFEFVSTT
nr:putative reverse transcriptase domain-containing protein [Tanacetum cinerariifolium]